LKLSSYYQYSSQCISSVTATLNDIYGLNVNLTADAKLSGGIASNWYLAAFNVTALIGTDANGAMYNCYLFMESVINVVSAKYASFVDTTDIYTSFLFNLLS
jgi:hypothetical protein